MELSSNPSNLAPSNAYVGEISTVDGLKLRYARWRPTTRRVRGTVMIIQGRAEFIEKYFETIRDLRRRGFAVLAFDLRGQGGSQRMLPEPRKGHVDDFMEYVGDIETMINQVMVQSMPRPHFALAHSMGAAALLLALHGGEARFERAVMLAPLAGLSMMRAPALAHAAAAALDFIALGTRYVPGGGATTIASRPFQGNRLTSDPVRYATMGETVTANPHLAIGDPTIRWTLAMFETFGRFANRDFGRDIATPTLMLIPGADPLCDPHAAEALALRIRACQPIVIPGARHELLTERDGYRDQVFAAIDAFLPGETSVEDLVAAEGEGER